MKAVIVSFGSFGDLIPVLNFAKSVDQYLGNVEFITYEKHRSSVLSYGLDFFGLGCVDEYNEMVSCAEGLDPYLYAAHHWYSCAKSSSEELFQYLIDNYSSSKDVVIMYHENCCSAGWAASKINARSCILRVSPFTNIDINFSSSEMKKSIDDLKSDLLGSFNERSESLKIALYPRVMESRTLDSVQGSVYMGFFNSKPKSLISNSNVPTAVKYLYTSGSAFCSSLEELDVFNKICEKFSAKGVFLSNNN